MGGAPPGAGVGASAAIGPVRLGHRFSRRPARLNPHVAERRARTHRLRGLGKKLDVHAASAAAADAARRATPSSISGVSSLRSASRRRLARTPTRSRWPATAAAAALVTGERLARAGVDAHDDVIVIHVSAGNPFRQWPASAFAAVAATLAARDPRRRIVITSGPSRGMPPSG